MVKYNIIRVRNDINDLIRGVEGIEEVIENIKKELYILKRDVNNLDEIDLADLWEYADDLFMDSSLFLSDVNDLRDKV